MKRTTFAWVAAVAALVVAAGPAAAGQDGEPDHGMPGTGEILPHPGPDGLIWIPDWIGNGGAVTGGASPNGLPVVVTVGCQGGSDGAGEVRVTYRPEYGDTTPVKFTVPCPADTVGRGSAVVTAEQGRAFYVGVLTSAPDVHWGLTVAQPES
ncbi:hypothetical protein ACFYST_35765 [Kitasatospora sp. NPDC004614]|uniref:hypothetical protein n=1 Tax=unclassified Kitasatospora TaxID=2633591 RepID=UPI00368BDDDE